MIRARVNVFLKEEVMDPQGNAVGQALKSLGYDEIEQVRVGRYFEVLLDEKNIERARERVEKMCDALLANTVIERYDVHVEQVSAVATGKV